MKVTLSMVALLLAFPTARADEEKEFADRLKKVEQRLRKLEQRVEARLAPFEARHAREARLQELAKEAETKAAAVQALLRQRDAARARTVNHVEALLKKAAAGDLKARKYLKDLRGMIDRVLGGRNLAQAFLAERAAQEAAVAAKRAGALRKLAGQRALAAEMERAVAAATKQKRKAGLELEPEVKALRAKLVAQLRKTELEQMRKAKLEAKLNALRDELDAQMQALKELQEKERERSKRKR